MPFIPVGTNQTECCFPLTNFSVPSRFQTHATQIRPFLDSNRNGCRIFTVNWQIAYHYAFDTPTGFFCQMVSTPWLFWISQKPNLIIVLLYIERILSFSLRHKMFSKFVPTLSISQVISFFSLSRNGQTAPLPPSSVFLCFVSPYLQLFFRCPARSTKQTWKLCFCFFTDGKQHKARSWHVGLFVFVSPCLQLFFDVLLGQRSKPGSNVFASSLTANNTKRDLDMIILRNHAPRSYMTWSPVTLSVPDMIIV